MTPVQNLYYAIGQLAYAIAMADGIVQKEERLKFHQMVTEELENDKFNFDISGIIFQIMDKNKSTLPDTYHWAMDTIRNNSHYLSPEIKTAFVRVMEKVAAAFPPVTIHEYALIEKFKKDIEPLHGDPVFYS